LENREKEVGLLRTRVLAQEQELLKCHLQRDEARKKYSMAEAGFRIAFMSGLRPNTAPATQHNRPPAPNRLNVTEIDWLTN
jgi:hypothetical protein